MKPILCALPSEILDVLSAIISGDEPTDKDGKKVKVVIEDDRAMPFEDDLCPYDGDCGECPYEEKCSEDTEDFDGWEITCEIDDDDDTEPDMWGIPEIDHVVFSGRATIVFWEDGTKTIVKCMEGEKFERYAGFAAACMKKMFGSTSRAKSVMDYFTVEQPVSAKKKKKNDDNAPLPGQITVDEVLLDTTPMDKVIQEAIDEALAK